MGAAWTDSPLSKNIVLAKGALWRGGRDTTGEFRDGSGASAAGATADGTTLHRFLAGPALNSGPLLRSFHATLLQAAAECLSRW